MTSFSAAVAASCIALLLAPSCPAGELEEVTRAAMEQARMASRLRTAWRTSVHSSVSTPATLGDTLLSPLLVDSQVVGERWDRLLQLKFSKVLDADGQESAVSDPTHVICRTADGFWLHLDRSVPRLSVSNEHDWQGIELGYALFNCWPLVSLPGTDGLLGGLMPRLRPITRREARGVVVTVYLGRDHQTRCEMVFDASDLRQLKEMSLELSRKESPWEAVSGTYFVLSDYRDVGGLLLPWQVSYRSFMAALPETGGKSSVTAGVIARESAELLTTAPQVLDPKALPRGLAVIDLTQDALFSLGSRICSLDGTELVNDAELASLVPPTVRPVSRSSGLDWSRITMCSLGAGLGGAATSLCLRRKVTK